jgi:hypothetical protein
VLEADPVARVPATDAPAAAEVSAGKLAPHIDAVAPAPMTLPKARLLIMFKPFDSCAALTAPSLRLGSIRLHRSIDRRPVREGSPTPGQRLSEGRPDYFFEAPPTLQSFDRCRAVANGSSPMHTPADPAMKRDSRKESRGRP